MTFFIWRRAGLAGLFTALLPFLLGPEVVTRYFSEQYPDYHEAVLPKLIGYGTSIVLTLIVILIARRVNKDGEMPLKEKLMLDHIYYVPLVFWPPLLALLCALSLHFKWRY